MRVASSPAICILSSARDACVSLYVWESSQCVMTLRSKGWGEEENEEDEELVGVSG